MEIRVTQDGAIPHFFGRTLYDAQQEAMFFNWTASGFAFAFYGDRVEMIVSAFAENFPGEAENLPWVAVFVDGQKEPRLIRMAQGRQTTLLFEGATAGEHTLRVVKLSENSKGRICLHSLLLSGEPLPYTHPSPRFRLEFIGDSITCGFGGNMLPTDTMFTTAQEDCMIAYPAVTAELLNAEYQSVCISGIPLCWASDPGYRLQLPGFPGFSPPPRAMEAHYAYTDRHQQEADGVTDGFEPWDFARFKPDAIVINLGTNDAFRISVSGSDPAEETFFRKRYAAFLHLLRSLNGPKPVIACTMGSMNYYLYDTIEKAVADYRQVTGDERVFAMKFGAIDPWGEGYGGMMHPNEKTHARMGRELAAALKPWLD
jgi:hypothetical protein